MENSLSVKISPYDEQKQSTDVNLDRTRSVIYFTAIYNTFQHLSCAGSVTLLRTHVMIMKSIV